MEREEGFEEPKGVNDAWAVNMKMVVERAQRLEEERQGQSNRMIEQAIATQARINEIAMQSLQAFTNSMDERQKDSRIQAVRKEHYAEGRMEELEEQLSRSQNMATGQDSGVNAQTGSINQVISEAIGGAIQELIASGKLKAY